MTYCLIPFRKLVEHEMLIKDQKSFYEENGYIILDNMLSEIDLIFIKSGIENTLDSIVARAKKENPNHKNVLDSANNISSKMNALEAVDHKYVAELHDCMSTANNPYVARIVSSEKVLNVVNSLMGNAFDNPLFMTSSMGIFSMPFNTEHTVNQWHTDTFYTCKDGQYVHFWAPIIEDATESLGSLHILPGSHKQPFKGEIRDTSNSVSDIHKFSISDDFVNEYDKEVVELKLGEGLFFHQYLVHRGGLNTTEKTRFGLVTLYHSMSSPDFTPYYLQHPKSLISSDEFFDETMLGGRKNNGHN